MVMGYGVGCHDAKNNEAVFVFAVFRRHLGWFYGHLLLYKNVVNMYYYVET